MRRFHDSSRPLGRLARTAVVLALPVTVACPKSEAEPTSPQPAPVAAPDAEPDPAVAELQAKVDQFAPAELTADLSVLPESERKALKHLVAAAELMDPIYDRQAWAGYVARRAELVADESDAGKLRLEYFDIMRGPWDRQTHFEPFAVDVPHPPGSGFYPEDLTKEEFASYVAANADQADALQSLVTVVSREGDKLVATPYSKAYAQWLEPAAQELEAAADATTNESLQTFLRSRAKAFRDDDYYQSDKDWMDLDGLVEITIGPYETYEDELMGLKASFEAFVTVSDPQASKDLAKFKALLPDMEQHLPIPKKVKTKRGAESPIRVVDLVYTSGDARKSVQTIAFNLPNDERVRKEKGAKKVMLRNIIKTKFERIMRPIAERLLDAGQLDKLSAEAFFQEVLFHELSHSLGPAFTKVNGKKVEVRIALGANYSPLEEAKADVMGAWNILYMIEKGEFPAEFRDQLLVSYFAGLFRSVRFGVAEAHGKGAAMQINRFLEEGAATFDAETGKFSVNLEQLPKSIESLVHDICILQHEGKVEAVEALFAKYGVVDGAIETALGSLEGIPVDIKPIYLPVG